MDWSDCSNCPRWTALVWSTWLTWTLKSLRLTTGHPCVANCSSSTQYWQCTVKCPFKRSFCMVMSRFTASVKDDFFACSDVLQYFSTCRTRSSSAVTLARPSVSSSFQITNRSFRYASPYLWNQLPSSFRQPHSVHSPPGSPHPMHVTVTTFTLTIYHSLSLSLQT